MDNVESVFNLWPHYRCNRFGLFELLQAFVGIWGLVQIKEIEDGPNRYT